MQILTRCGLRLCRQPFQTTYRLNGDFFVGGVLVTLLSLNLFKGKSFSDEKKILEVFFFSRDIIKTLRIVVCTSKSFYIFSRSPWKKFLSSSDSSEIVFQFVFIRWWSLQQKCFMPLNNLRWRFKKTFCDTDLFHVNGVIEIITHELVK